MIQTTLYAGYPRSLKPFSFHQFPFQLPEDAGPARPDTDLAAGLIPSFWSGPLSQTAIRASVHLPPCLDEQAFRVSV